jgi:DNA-binding XRE family transcriptional regulator
MKSLPNAALRDAREAANLTQQALADLLGVTKQAVSDWECNRNHPSPRRAIAITKLLPNIDIEDIFPAAARAPRRTLDVRLPTGAFARRVSIPRIWAAA